MIAPMPYSRRPTWPDHDREDYVIRCEARDVGRVYRRRLPEGHRYYWTIGISPSSRCPELGGERAQKFGALGERAQPIG